MDTERLVAQAMPGGWSIVWSIGWLVSWKERGVGCKKVNVPWGRDLGMVDSCCWVGRMMGVGGGLCQEMQNGDREIVGREVGGGEGIKN